MSAESSYPRMEYDREAGRIRVVLGEGGPRFAKVPVNDLAYLWRDENGQVLELVVVVGSSGEPHFLGEPSLQGIVMNP